MDIFEKINRAFGGWYEGLFGGGDDVRPRAILQKIVATLENNRKEGFDNKTWVPNQYILEIAVNDPEERDYLLSFLDQDELETAVQRYCKQNNYHIRGALDFTIREITPTEEGKPTDKVRILCRYAPLKAEYKPEAEAEHLEAPRQDMESPTVARVFPIDSSEDEGTVPAIASANLTIHSPNRPAREYPVARAAVTIGRSSHAGNDIVLEDDGQVSRRHARIEMDSDGVFTLYDLDTTNGTLINGRRVDNRLLKDGDEVTIGSTRVIFHQSFPAHAPEPVAYQAAEIISSTEWSKKSRLILIDGVHDVDEYPLASETLIGRGLTNHITLADRSISTRHALIRRGNPSTIESIAPDALIAVNDIPVPPDSTAPLHPGDRITLGNISLRYEE